MDAEGIDLVVLMKEAAKRCLEKTQGDIGKFKTCMMNEIEEAARMVRVLQYD